MRRNPTIRSTSVTIKARTLDLMSMPPASTIQSRCQSHASGKPDASGSAHFWLGESQIWPSPAAGDALCKVGRMLAELRGTSFWKSPTHFRASGLTDPVRPQLRAARRVTSDRAAAPWPARRSVRPRQSVAKDGRRSDHRAGRLLTIVYRQSMFPIMLQTSERFTRVGCCSDRKVTVKLVVDNEMEDSRGPRTRIHLRPRVGNREPRVHSDRTGGDCRSSTVPADLLEHLRSASAEFHAPAKHRCRQPRQPDGVCRDGTAGPGRWYGRAFWSGAHVPGAPAPSTSDIETRSTSSTT